ncbi:segregation and condensation protein A [Lysobacter sp. cf310]|uniref:segregation and condensation protein A n=1 Tax=Lysobacter sp. cf310 TaxID=1761790 RepID=UPI0008ED7E7F|nr:ScpA family protein [Lysobacter sp. cf310]SFK96996.1 condensin subunit ScpA [Lysobacter sp. cf310]
MTNENVSDEAQPDESAPDASAAEPSAAGAEPASPAPDDTAPAADGAAASAASRPQQQEMPLAMIHGQPVLQIPQDLYIPPDALEVILEAFEGPLDLLLYLIRRQNLDILDIPVADITRQYVQYIQAMHEMRFELAADYLVMAAMLAEIKSRMLLPRAPNEEGIEEDPRADLVRRLQEYERFKKAAEDIDALPRQDRDTVPVQAFVPDRASIRLPPPVDLKEMLLALHDVFKRAELYTQHAIKRDALSVRQRMGELLTRMADGVFHRFESLFTVEEGRLGVVVTFLGLLTLAKEQLIEIVQEGPLEPIYVKSLALMKDPDEIELSSEFDHAANDDPNA